MSKVQSPRFWTKPLPGDLRPRYVLRAVAGGLLAAGFVFFLMKILPPPQCDLLGHCTTVVAALNK